MQVYWNRQSDPQYTFVLVGSNDEIELSLVPGDRWPVASEEGTMPPAPSFFVKSDSDRTERERNHSSGTGCRE